MKELKYYNDAKLLSIIAERLNFKSIEYALMRKAKGLPDRIISSDVDFIINKKFKNIAIQTVEDIAAEYDYRIIWRNPLSYIYGLILAKYEKGIVKYLKVDFFIGFSWRGINLVDEDQIFNNVEYRGSIPILAPDTMNSLSFINDVLYKKMFTKENIEVYKSKIESGELLKEDFYFPDFSSIKLSTELDLRAIRKDLVNSVKRNSKYYSSFLSFKAQELKLRKALGYQISFSGPDGSGKSSVAKCLSEFFETIKLTNKLDHYLPSGYKNIHELKIVPKNNAVKTQNYTAPYSLPNVSKFQSIIRLSYYSIVFTFAYKFYVEKLKRNNEVVIFDRYFIDMISDPTRSRLSLSKNIVYHFFSHIKTPDLTFIFIAEPHKLIERKGELSQEKAVELYAKYQETSMVIGANLYLNNGSFESALTDTFNTVFKKMEKHYEAI